MPLHYTPQGIAYICWDWISIFFELVIVSLRLYSRSMLTRSIGSDDFAIVIAAVSHLRLKHSSVYLD